MNAPALALELCRTLIDQGVEHVVLSPGSRNAPLSLALASAARDGRLRLHVRLDERTAGFVALGIARATGRPVAVVTTSGTAVANLHPAVLEARHSGLPLVVLSADRPLSMWRSGANQTCDQDGLFGPSVLDAALISNESGGPADWRWVLQRSLALAAGTRTLRPGPVQLDIALAEPLTDPSLMGPVAPADPTARYEVAAARRAEPHRLGRGPRTVVLVGDARPEVGARARDLAERAGWPLLAEPSSNARAGTNAVADYVTRLGSPLAERIERVVVFGHRTLSRPVTRLLRRDDVEVIVVASQAEWTDPGHRGRAVVDGVEVDDADATADAATDAAATDAAATDAAAADAAAGRQGTDGSDPATAAAPPTGTSVSAPDEDWLDLWLADRGATDPRSADRGSTDHGLADRGDISGSSHALTGQSADARGLADRRPTDRRPVADEAPADGWTRAGIASDVLESVGADGVLMIGSSQVARDLDRAPIAARPPRVHANRGLAGIDGTLSTALGLRLGGDRPVTVLLGDLATLHDLGALVGGDHEDAPGVRVVVVDDHGGGIFAALEQADAAYAEHFDRVFATPQRVDLAAALAGLGASVTTVGGRADLREALARPQPDRGWEVIIATVDPVRDRVVRSD